MSNYTVHTIGHSTHPIETFIELLEEHQIDCVIDVRSTPYSKFNPQYNKEPLQKRLFEHEILYAHFGKEFGARHTSPSMLDSMGKVEFDKVRASKDFQQGIVRLEGALDQGYRVVLMCSEKDPLNCHRFSMISYQLIREGFDVFHILEDGEVLSNEVVEKEMLKKYHSKIPQNELFNRITTEEQLETAYQLCGHDIAYRPVGTNFDNEDEINL